MSGVKVAIASALLLACRILVGGVLVVAAFFKLWGDGASARFYETVKAYDLLPKHLNIVATFAFPWLEAVAGVCLIVGLWTRAAALVASALFVSFIYAIAIVIRSGVGPDDCGCLGKLNEYIQICPKGPPGWCNIWMDIALLGLALVVLFAGPGVVAVDRLLRPRPLPPPELFKQEPREGRPV